ncbi:MAG: phosphoribosylanthranilate isomerase [Clostridiales bacterium]|nr:phosphoribosylanthranilate isomerase [Clostridiales bacterium]
MKVIDGTRVQIKICGLSRPEDIRAVNELKPDYAGFVFFEKSKRNISFEKAKELLALLNPDIRSVAVCVSPTPDFLKKAAGYGFDIIQIHGEIMPEVFDRLQTPVWQAVNLKKSIQSDDAIAHLICRHPNICGYVVDGADYGGGKTFGWEDDADLGTSAAGMIRHALSGRQFILAGGLNAENVQTGIRLFHPDVVDVSSGVELGNYKDRDLMEQFISRVREL